MDSFPGLHKRVKIRALGTHRKRPQFFAVVLFGSYPPLSRQTSSTCDTDWRKSKREQISKKRWASTLIGCRCAFSRDSVTRFFASVFCESSSPKPLIIALGSFQIFSKIRGDICKSRCTTGINDIGGKFAAGVNYTVGKLATNTASVVDTGGKFATSCQLHRQQIFWRCQRHRWCTLSCEYLHEFSKAFETFLIIYSGARGKLILEKICSRKSRDTVPLKLCENHTE